MTEVAAALDRQLLRNCYGSFPVGVTVVTTREASGRLAGLTVSSFNSISMDPPLVSVSIIRQTPSHDALLQCDEFAISILNTDQGELARRFATPSTDKFRDVELEPSQFTSPIVAGAAAWFVCKPDRALTVGDHTLLIGEVVECQSSDAPALAYHRGKFHSLSEQRPGSDGPSLHGQAMVGFIVERDAKIALVRSQLPQFDGWSLPAGALHVGRNTDESLRVTARHLVGAPVEPDFLYSIIDLHEHVACSIYRGRLLEGPPGRSAVCWFEEGEIPWEDVGPTVMATVLRRYLQERVADQFGVFVSVGGGRLAAIHSETEWRPTPEVND